MLSFMKKKMQHTVFVPFFVVPHQILLENMLRGKSMQLYVHEY